VGPDLHDDMGEVRKALIAFRGIYNVSRLIERHGFIRPAAFRRNELQPAANAA
jgi:putative transposase